MNRLCTVLAMCGGIALALAAGAQVSPLYIWNGSESVPTGLYRVQEAGQLMVPELVAVRPPGPLARFLDVNGYLPSGAPMLKRVAAVQGQEVCRTGLSIIIDRIEMGAARERDGRGQPLPTWQGCRIMAKDEIFLMNWQSAGSLDGRYFGPIPSSAVIGLALPVWTREE